MTAAAKKLPADLVETIKVGDPGSPSLHEALYRSTSAVSEIRHLMGLRSAEAQKNLHVNAKYEPTAKDRLDSIELCLTDAIAEIRKTREARS